MIPETLYRGDSDSSNKRLLRTTINHYQLQTNLINGGIGREINEKPILELINRHLNFEWDKTHFLSFSTDENVALKYGLNKENIDPTNIENFCSEQFDDDENWNFVVVKLLTSKIDFKTLDKGIYEGTYPPSLLKFAKNNCKLILINVLDVLADTDYSVALENARRDKEWLLLPANLFYEQGQIEYSAIFDIGNIGEIQKYIKHD